MLRRLEEAKSRRCVRSLASCSRHWAIRGKKRRLTKAPALFRRFPFFWWAKVSTSWARRLRVNRGSGRRLGFGFAGGQSPKRALAGARKLCFACAGQGRRASRGRGRARLGRMPLASPLADPRSLRLLGSWFFGGKTARSVDVKEHNKMTTLKSSAVMLRRLEERQS